MTTAKSTSTRTPDSEKRYARTTITVPRELKERMKSLQGYVNWSEVASQAFEAKVSELILSEGAQQMDEVVERLRRFTERNDENTAWHARGFEQGRQWAMNQAAPDQLKRIEDFRDQVSDDEWERLFLEEVGPDCGWRKLAYAIDPSADPKNGARKLRAKQVMRRVIGRSKVDELDFMRGFAEGAIEIWREVKDRL